MLKRLVFLALTLLLAIATIAPTVSAEEENGLDGLTKEQIEKFWKEVEYIFTKIVIFDEETGYTVNEDELEKSPYTKGQKEGMIAFAKYMNKEYKYASVQKNTVQRSWKCYCISKGALDKVQKAIEKGDWWTVLEYLGKLGLAISLSAVFTFFLFCGATPAKIAPQENW